MQRKNDALIAQVTQLLWDQRREDDNWRVVEEIVQFQPYSPEVASVPIPENLKVYAWALYGGDKDPRVHLEYFNGRMVLHGASDQLKCRLFPLTLKDSAGSITNITDLS